MNPQPQLFDKYLIGKNILTKNMNFETKSINPAVKAFVAGTAPRPAQLAAARGMMPLAQADLLEALVALSLKEDLEVAESAKKTLKAQDKDALNSLLKSNEAAPSVLDYFAAENTVSQEIHESIIANPNTHPNSLLKLIRNTQNGELLELISFNQQLLIKTPEIIEAISANSFRTAEAERRAQETKREFFEKERGAQQIANELRAQGKDAAAEFVETAEFSDISPEDAILLAQMIEVPDSEIDDSWLSFDYLEEIYEETDEQRESIVNKILGEMSADDDEIPNERVSMISRILRMNMKDRVKLAMKGDREARTILIRDPNRVVSQGVINNPRITEQEVEKIAAMRTVTEEVLRLIATNRNWARNYNLIHTLAKNPRTPISNAMTILTRLQLRDLQAISKNRNVSDAVRRQSLRLYQARTGVK